MGSCGDGIPSEGKSNSKGDMCLASSRESKEPRVLGAEVSGVQGDGAEVQWATGCQAV